MHWLISYYLRVRVDDRGHAVVVNVDGSAEHTLAGNDALVLGLVGQHGAVDAVADGVNVGNHRLESKCKKKEICVKKTI